MTFAAYAANWLAGFIDDAPDRARFEAALEHRLVPVLGELPLAAVLELDRNGLRHRLVQAGVDTDDQTAWECLREVLENAADEVRCGDFDVGEPVGVSRSRR